VRTDALIAQTLVEHGVRSVFGLMGEDTAELTLCLAGCGIEYLSTRHESIAVGMADGYYRASGDPGVALLSRGPGFTNALTTMTTAARGRSGVVVLTGDTSALPDGAPVPARRHAKYVDQAAVLDALGLCHMTLRATSARADLTEALRAAAGGVTVVVNIPADVLRAEAGDGPTAARLPSPAEFAGPPDPDAVAAVADLLADGGARRPVVLAGRGAVRAGAGESLARLAEATGALLATTLFARSMFAGLDYDVGVVGPSAPEVVSRLLADADLVLAFGASLSPFTTRGGTLFPGARVVQVDADPGALSTAADVQVLGDAELTATAISVAVQRRTAGRGGYRTPATRELLRSAAAATPVPRDGGRGLDPRALTAALDDVLPRERTVVVDNGHNWTWPTSYLSVPEPSAYISPIEFACVGAATGVALGAALARPDRLTVLGIGDGGHLMTLTDVDTAVRYRIPLVVLVFNDAGFGAEVHYLQAAGLPDDMARLPAPSFAAIARSVGARGVTVEHLDDLPEVTAALESLDGPLVVDCVIDPEVRAPWVEFFFAQARAG